MLIDVPASLESCVGRDDWGAKSAAVEERITGVAGCQRVRLIAIGLIWDAQCGDYDAEHRKLGKVIEKMHIWT